MLNSFSEMFRSVVRARTFRQSGITMAGTVITGILGMVFYIFVARSLGPASFGSFSVAVSVMTVIASIGDVGTNTGLVRFVGKYYSRDEIKTKRFLKLGLEIKLLVWILVLAVGIPLSPWLAESLFKKPELVIPLRIALVGVGGGLLYSYAGHAVQAVQKFFLWSTTGVMMNVLRLLAMFILIYLGILNLLTGIWLYFIFLFAGFFIGLLFLPKFIFVKDEGSILGEFFKFNKWVAAFTVISAMTARLDMLITARLLPLAAVGIYSVAVSLSTVVPQIVYSLAIVAAPKLSGFERPIEAISYLKKLQVFVIGLAILGVSVGIPLSRVVIPAFYGTQYLGSGSDAFCGALLFFLSEIICPCDIWTTVDRRYFGMDSCGGYWRSGSGSSNSCK
jgi:O-antigen/teichoic acid export membrane protein